MKQPAAGATQAASYTYRYAQYFNMTTQLKQTDKQ
jgi:hypothetical protein